MLTITMKKFKFFFKGFFGKTDESEEEMSFTSDNSIKKQSVHSSSLASRKRENVRVEYHLPVYLM